MSQEQKEIKFYDFFLKKKRRKSDGGDGPPWGMQEKEGESLKQFFHSGKLK